MVIGFHQITHIWDNIMNDNLLIGDKYKLQDLISSSKIELILHFRSHVVMC